jgi:MFS family permease
MSEHTQGMQIESLVRASFKRTKERFLSYFLATVITYGFGIAAALVIAIIVGLHFLIFGLTRSTAVTATSGIIFGIASVAGLIYVGAWGQLATISVITSDKKRGVIETFNELREAVWGYFWLSALVFLFTTGIIIFGMVGLVIPGIILAILWSLWGAFTPYVYLEHRRKGLENLWLSQALFNTNFWGNFGRMALIFLAIIVVVWALLFGSIRYNLVGFVSPAITFFITPFIYAFVYEMYRHQRKVTKVKTPVVWIILSIVGWVIVIGLILFMGSYISQELPMWEKNFDNEMIFQKAQLI